MKSTRVLTLEITGLLLCLGTYVYISHSPEQETGFSTTPLQASEQRASLRYQEMPSGSLPTIGEEVRPKEHPGLKLYKPEKTFPGVTLLAENASEKGLLLSPRGEVIHSWDFDIERARLLPNCNLLVLHGSKWGLANQPWKYLRRFVREYTWEGELVWEYEPQTAPHHDVHKLPNGNVLVLRHSVVPDTLKKKLRDPVKRAARIKSDALEEVTPTGEVVWSWKFYKHFDLTMCGLRPCPRLLRDIDPNKTFKFDWSHMNTAAPLPDNKWYDAGDKRFKPGNIMILPRNWSTAYIIDKNTKKPVWYYHGEYNGGLRGGHEAHMIEKGLPGAGNILIFDNGIKPGVTGKKASSHILEIDPVSKKIVWMFEDGKNFFSKASGAVQRLPNGNTLISEDLPGKIFEVTPEGERVWEYQASNRLARAKKYDLDYCPRIREAMQRADGA